MLDGACYELLSSPYILYGLVQKVLYGGAVTEEPYAECCVTYIGNVVHTVQYCFYL